MGATVAIIGRPNVGKSTLFNRLVGKRLALVDDTPGVTRDRRPGEARLGDLRFTVIDTAGLEDAEATSLEGRMRAQTEEAIVESDVVLFVIDARAGVTPLDAYFADVVRKSDKPVILLANKAEGRAGEGGLYEAFALGLGEPVAISAEHGEGLAGLYSALLPFVEQVEEDEQAAADEARFAIELDEDGQDLVPEIAAGTAERPLRVAIVGRPNAGKSTLINRMLGEERMLTGPEAGITRDSISVDWLWRDRHVKLFDTAGIRRKARVQEKLEKLSVADALRAIKFAEVVVVALDATNSFEKQDLQIIELCAREGRALVIAINKWDLIEDREAAWQAIRDAQDRYLNQIRGVAICTLSGLQGQGIDRLMEAVFGAYDVWNTRISTARLNRWLTGILAHHPPPAVQGRRVKLRYMTQAKTRPPHFFVFCSRPEELPESYTRYLVNNLREKFEMPGTPIRLSYRKGDNPFAGKAKQR
ncbi:ribosome biogenesis GTPase Der [Microvirga tunisiensis]|uniref:Ribosome biogenesis GTPase Der n=2 Tax=Pannonibacter tanglangensis TaxID=2750084 RepID=A0ABW9ZJF5_9HYPH|nr:MULTISPECIES: ribosome biogenesis GTPase Der [unclassified Pannonibacter]NBN64072.1 ribosome biogenesis GTPase Der [Pannonibacter sp. XCT-34]NBN77713.1 ribosome biogenesis GTPase Der [Pannonibacter sp. XCT-53]